MSESVDALLEFWKELEKQPILVKDLSGLSAKMANAAMAFQELYKSRENWKAKYNELKKNGL